MEHAQGEADHLQVFAASGGADIPGLGTHIVDDGPLEPRDEEMRALVDYAFLDARNAVEDHGPRTAFNVVQRRISHRDAHRNGNGVAGEGVEHGGHLVATELLVQKLSS